MSDNSEIERLVKDYKWEELFSNKDWLMTLDSSQQFMFSFDESFSSLFIDQLHLIESFFPEETKDFLVLPD